MPLIQKVIKDANEFILEKPVKVYFKKKKWQWDIRKTSKQAVQPSVDTLGKLNGPLPCKRIQTSILLDLADKRESESNTNMCSDSREAI